MVSQLFTEDQKQDTPLFSQFFKGCSSLAASNISGNLDLDSYLNYDNWKKERVRGVPMKKQKLLGQNGITLVEIIIVIAIIGILASTSVMMIGHLHYANTQKVVRTLDASLDALQVRTMSKAGSSYLYIYKLDNGYYTRVLPDNLGSF